jgi:hypothetical protein
VAGSKRVDLEAWEWAIREAVLCAGATVLERMLRELCSGRRDEPVVCGCGSRMESRGVREKEVTTILGPVRIGRSMFRCPACGRTRYPGDEELDVEGTGYSPGLRRMMARAGSNTTFKEGREDLQVYAGITVSAKSIERVSETIGAEMERWARREGESHVEAFAELPERERTIPHLYVSMDGTGVPMTKRELAGRAGKQPDGSAKTREVKLGCAFTQTTVDDEGRPVRDPESTSFVGAIESAEPFGERIFAEAVRRGLALAHEVAVLGDGAAWVRGIAETYFPGAVQIIDLYHAREHVSNLCKDLFGSDEQTIALYRAHWWDYLDAGTIETIIAEARAVLPRNRQRRAKAKAEIGFLENNKERMRYNKFRAMGFFVGSGVVEAGCKSIIAHRLKQSGMEWSLRGANAIIALRCVMKSGRLEDYWEARTA